MTDWRERCTALVDKIDYTWGDIPDDLLVLLDRIRAELVKPEPEGLNDEAWKEFIEQVQHAQHVAIREGETPRFDLVEMALALWREAAAISALAQPEQPVSEHRPVWTEGICGDGAAILKDGVMQPIEDVVAALNATSLAQSSASWWRSSVGPTNYNEDFWRRDALEKLVHAAASFRLGVYSAEELEIFENRARAVLARFGRPAIEPVPVAERLPGEGD